MSSYPSPSPSMVLTIDSFSGVNWGTHSSRIANNEAEIMENFYIKENGVLSKRSGITNILSSAYSDNILEMIEYNNFLIVGSSMYIFKIDLSSNAREIIHTYDTSSGNSMPTYMKMFILNDKLYILDGMKFKEYDGTNLVNVQDKAYTPTLFITCLPSNGSGAELEQWNMISDTYKQSFNGDGTSKDYFMALGQCDVLEVIVDGVVLKKTADYTDVTDNSTTEINFVNAPPKGIDNVIIKARLKEYYSPLYAKKVEENIKRINKSSVYSLYGGQNDTRLLLAGQDSVFYRSDVYNPYYFPENYYQSVGDTDEKIMGFVTQYDYCVILKERSIWHTRFELLDDGTSAYITKPLNAEHGCINNKTVQLINNAPMFLSEKGLAVISQTSIRDENNVSIISERIHGINGLLQEDFTKGISIDYDNKYMIAFKNIIYIYDYLYDCFYIWKFNFDDFYINSLTSVDGDLFIGTGTGNVYRYKNGSTVYQDNICIGDTVYEVFNVNAIWKSKLFAFDDFYKYKTIENLFLTIGSGESTSVDISYITDKNTEVIVGTTSNNLFTYDRFNYKKMSYLSTYYPVVENLKMKLKKVIFFQLFIENIAEDETLDIYSLGFKFKIQKEVKK